MIELVVYILGVLFGTFIVIPYLKARGVYKDNDNNDDEFVITMSILIGALLWPISLPVILIILFFFFAIFKPGVKIFDRATEFFTVQPKVEELPNIDESKSNYRNIGYKVNK